MSDFNRASGLEAVPQRSSIPETGNQVVLANTIRSQAHDALVDPAAPVKPQRLPAPAILRPRAEMQAAERTEMGLSNYQGAGKAAAFFEWANPDGSPREGDADLKLVTVDRLVHAFPPEALRLLSEKMPDAELTLGPGYGNIDIDFAAMVLSMDRTQGRTPQKGYTHVGDLFGYTNPQHLLEGERIQHWRPTLIRGGQNPQPHPYDDTEAEFSQRLAAWHRFLEGTPFTGTDLLAYADFMALSLAAQQPADTYKLKPSTCTILDADDYTHGSEVLRGLFRIDSGEPYFSSSSCPEPKPYFLISRPECIGEHDRFRSVLNGENV